MSQTAHYFSVTPASDAPAHIHPKCKTCNARFVDGAALREHMVDFYVRFSRVVPLPAEGLQYWHGNVGRETALEGTERGLRGWTGVRARA
ncbi:hypothetical protein HWV62_22648 [Athelia sp. TMB]|nr:hypothetical protein HWV62_22648 [Athelia sp. TMB]